ncbi:MAG TPA: lipocalin family protein [Phycisphaerae bacterium]|nr:lipocalin family protein [Phycisphaerae bacterium]HRW54248.1 lipocalin family protein [Phycisphaerae bacterium]
MPRLPITIVIVTTLAALTISCALCDRGVQTADVGIAPPEARSMAETDQPDAARPMTMTEIESAGMPSTQFVDADDDRPESHIRADRPLTTVPDVELDRYMGRWYEIGRYPNPYQAGVVGVIAEYTLQDDGEILVRNYGRSGSLDAELTESTATAWVADTRTNARWFVQFIWPFRADYWIIDLDDDYQYAVVGQPERERLWILSRSPTLPDTTLAAIIERLRELGYDPSRIEMTPQRESE